MSFRKIDPTQWWPLSLLRADCNIELRCSDINWKYWVHTASPAYADTACIKLCADRGDPFAKRLWARIIAARMK